MENEKKLDIMNIKPLANEEAVVSGDKYRFTVLTDCMIRMEYQEEGCFTDEPTQTVICREFPVPEFTVVDKPEGLEIITKALHLYYNKKEFTAEGLFVYMKERYTLGDSVWNYGDPINDLRGTARTLDDVNGATELEQGLMSRVGFTVWDDTKATLLTEDGWVKPREKDAIDCYFFGYGHNYQRCLKDFYHLSGATPLLPKYTLGNWWSRFYPYTEENYIQLMEKFEEKDIPFSVSVIDMDWHLTDIPQKYGSGWTGYTWNPKYFPNPKRFLSKLHDMGKKITLNLHPADGVRAHEDAYLPMAKALGVDYENEVKIPFNVTDKKYMEAYFKYLHHPLEEEGVDFWWIDWQQGTQSRTKGIDPLWMLNHLHFVDSARDGKLPLTFSRYAGLGSHRYPIGFSGDSYSTWESLNFQPYFTTNATNVGYTWWSHDIGGHQKGRRDDELVVRWIQYGVFSPIMRLHSTANEFYGKEPWNYNMMAEKAITEFLRLRHKLVPYLHTWNYRTHLQGEALIQPMYYRHDVNEAYEVPNEYYFGDMIVCPITKPADKETLLGEVEAWIPEGTYFDFFTGQVYRGGQKQMLYRNMDSIPVLVPAGGIIPMAADYASSCTENPKTLDVVVFNGADGKFELYEDNCNEMMDMEPATTSFTYTVGDIAQFTVAVSEDAEDVIPADRSYCVRIRGMESLEADAVNVQEVVCDGELSVETAYNELLHEAIIKVNGTNIKKFTLFIKPVSKLIALPDGKEAVRNILHPAQLEYDTKEKVFDIIKNETEIVRIVAQLHKMNIKHELFGAILERIIPYI
uniref:TIM-barrel domain-containing protein n=1 Tax=Acetatifactor sp. TaxID=1872090 RepID=UPI004056DFE5